MFSTEHLSAFGQRAKSRVFGCDNSFTTFQSVPAETDKKKQKYGKWGKGRDLR